MGAVLSWLGWGSSQEDDVCQCDLEEMFTKYRDDFYGAGVKYWETQKPTVDGMLGGFPETSGPDLRFSKSILDEYLKSHQVGRERCADVACGIGRVSLALLRHYWKQIDLVEPVQTFIDQAETSLVSEGVTTRKFTCGAQDWNPDVNYDCIWAQWTLMFMTDDDAVAFLKRCKQHLSPNGIIVVKENTVVSDDKAEGLWFQQDHSTARTVGHFLDLFKKARLKLVVKRRQDDWSEGLVPLFMFILTKK